jgi:hypothetical protein
MIALQEGKFLFRPSNWKYYVDFSPSAYVIAILGHLCFSYEIAIYHSNKFTITAVSHMFPYEHEGKEFLKATEVFNINNV